MRGGNFVTCSSNPIMIGATANPNITTYSWTPTAGLDDPSLAQPTATLTETTIYELITTDVNGCRDRDSATVIVQGDETIDAIQCADLPVSIGLVTLAGYPGVTFSWSPTTNISCTSCPLTQVTLPSGSQTYSQTINFTASDGDVCSIIKTYNVTREEMPTPNFAGADKAICFGGTTTIGTPAVSGFTYNWAPGYYLDKQFDIDEPTVNPGTVWPIFNNPQTYYVTAISTGSGCSFVDSVKVYDVRAEAAQDGCGPRTIGGLADYTNGEATYSWVAVSTTGGDPWVLDDPSLPQPYVTSSNPGNEGTTTFELTVTWGGISCVDTVVVPPCLCPVPILVTDTQWGCGVTENSGDAVGISVANPDPLYNYTWSPSTNINTTNGTEVIVTPTSLTTYTVTATHINDPSVFCTSNIDIGLPPSTLPSHTTQDHDICAGDPVNIGGSSTFGWTYEWSSSPDGFSSSDSDPLVSPTETTTYYVTVTDAATGCMNFDTAIVAVVGYVPDIGEATYQICTGGTLTLGQPVETGVTYNWSSNPSGLISTSAQVMVSPTVNTTYYLTTTDALGCIATDSTVVTIEDNPSVNFGTLSQTRCANVSSVFFGGSFDSKVDTYTWTVTGGTYTPGTYNNDYRIRVFPDAGATSITADVVATFIGGCTDSETLTATLNPLPEPTITVTSQTCTNITVEAAPAGLTRYFWYINNAYSGFTTTTTKTFTNYPSDGDFSIIVRAQDANFCSGYDTIYVSPSTIVNAGEDQLVCPNTPVTIGPTAEAGYTYSWTSSPAGTYPNTSQITVSPSENTTYTLSANNGSGCIRTDNIVITTLDVPDLPASIPVLVCDNSCQVIGPEEEAFMTYSWSPSTELSDPNIAQPIVCPTANRNYTLQVTTPEGCIVTSTYAVSLNGTTGFIATATGEEICLQQTQSQLNVEPSTGSYSYNWSPSTYLNDPTIANPIANPISTTTYLVTVTDDATGCLSMASAEVVVTGLNCCPDISDISLSLASLCGGDNFDATITHSADLGDLGLYYSSNASLTAAELYDFANHGTNGISTLNTAISPAAATTSTLESGLSIPTGGNYTVYAILANGNSNIAPPSCLPMDTVNLIVNDTTAIFCERYRIRENDVWGAWTNFSGGNCTIELCEGDGLSDIQFDGGPDINTGWVWEDEDGNIDSEVDEIVVFGNLKVDDSGAYTGTLTDANGCVSSLNFEVIVHANPTYSCEFNTDVTGWTADADCAASFCEGTTGVQLRATPNAASYSWTGPNGFTTSAREADIGTFAAVDTGYLYSYVNRHERLCYNT